ncbi:MAG: hypothetical protein II622_04350, partial [Thermoguttaceae bacterium]|nr:hypothetical protein [Thermoguttaceae bacterium]
EPLHLLGRKIRFWRVRPVNVRSFAHVDSSTLKTLKKRPFRKILLKAVRILETKNQGTRRKQYI